MSRGAQLCAGTIVALLGAVPLSSEFGLPGAATALLAIDVAMVAYAVPAALRVVEEAPVQFLRGLLDVPRADVQAVVADAFVVA